MTTESLTKKLEQYILQQRKRNIVIHTNSKTMRRLLIKAHPNIIVEVIKPQTVNKPKISSELFIDDFSYPNPMLFKPSYKAEDKPATGLTKELQL